MLNYKLGETKEVDFFNNKNDLTLLAVTNDGTPVLVDGSTVDEPEIDYNDPKFKREIAYRTASNVNKTIPIGTMMMWLNKDTIPSGWHLCDGSKIDDLNISNSSKTKLKNVLDSDGYLPKLLYIDKEDGSSLSVFLGTCGDKVFSDTISRNGGERIIGNVKLDDNDKNTISKKNYSFQLTLYDLPFHAHMFKDYYIGEQANANHHLNESIRCYTSKRSQQGRENYSRYYTDGFNKEITGATRNNGGWFDYTRENKAVTYLWARNITDGMLRHGDGGHTIKDENISRDGYDHTDNPDFPKNLNNSSHTYNEWLAKDDGINYSNLFPPMKFNLYYIIKIE